MNAVRDDVFPSLDDRAALQPRVEPVRHTGRDTRIKFVDNARAIGIVLVVLGHAPALPGFASDLIFAFHMPLFFFLSGIVVARERLQMPTAQRAALLARTLLVPYVFYFVLAFVYWLVAKRHGLRALEFEALPWWDPLVGFVVGSADGLYVDVVLWFFPCLFVTAVAHHALCRRVSINAAAAFLATVAVAYVVLRDPAAARWWWSADCAVVAIGFYAVGVACNGFLRHPDAGLGRFRTLAAACLALAACALLTRFNGHVDLNHLDFGRSPALYLPMALFGIAAVVAFAATLPATRLARWLSLNTLVIFPLHFLMFSLFTGVAIEVFGLGTDFKASTPLNAPLYAVGALLLCWPAAIAFRRRLPWLFHPGHNRGTSGR